MRPKWSPTHWIIFTPVAGTGKPETWHVMVIPDPDGDPGSLLAIQRGDKPHADPDWKCDPTGTWTWCGQATPNKHMGKITVLEVSGGHRL